MDALSIMGLCLGKIIGLTKRYVLGVKFVDGIKEVPKRE
jgi:hypothetical protein